MRRLVLALLLVAGAASAQPPTDTGRTGTGAIEGVVRDSAGRLLGGALVALARPVRAALSDSAGRFRVDALPADTVDVAVTHAGYAPANFALAVPPNTTVYVAVQLVSAQKLGTVVVSAERRDAALNRRGFYDRGRMGRGKFFDPDWMQRRSYQYLTAALREVPLLAVQCRGESASDCTVRDASGCVPPVWIDGVPHYDTQGNMNTLIPLQDVRAMEVYRRPSEVPPEFATLRARSCGAIVLWTRFAR